MLTTADSQQPTLKTVQLSGSVHKPYCGGAKPHPDIAVLFHESATSKLSAIAAPKVAKALIIIGPEGGITDEELEAFTSSGAKIALMGRPIFRSAHAGIAGLAAVQTLLKSW